jgi:hypothetical protein
MLVQVSGWAWDPLQPAVGAWQGLRAPCVWPTRHECGLHNQYVGGNGQHGPLMEARACHPAAHGLIGDSCISTSATAAATTQLQLGLAAQLGSMSTTVQLELA